MKDFEYGTFYNSKTKKLMPIVKGSHYFISTPLDAFIMAHNNGYDTRVHTHPFNVAVPSIDDIIVWIQVFPYIKRQVIVSKKEILTCDFSNLSINNLKHIENFYKKLSEPIMKDFEHLTFKKVVEWGGVDNIDEMLQIKLKEVFIDIMKEYPNIMFSITR